MAESHFFMTQGDSADFLSFLIERFSAEFVPERSDCSPPFPRYRTLTEVRARIDLDVGYSRFAVLSPAWERLPLAFNEIHANDGRHFFSVSSRYGGPAFDLILSRTWTDGRGWIVPGSFADFPYYIEDKAFLTDRSLYRTFDRPDAMTAAHKELRKYLRRNGCRSASRETGHAGPWIIQGALREYEAGIWLREADWHFQPKGGRADRVGV